MAINASLIYDTKRKMLAKYPRFGSEIATTNIEFKDDLPYHTAATDGKNIYVDPNYFASLSEDDRLFIIAHEIMHIKFMHMYRLMDKGGQRRDPELWNIATDAIINANLERDGFTIKEGYVNRPEALNCSAEEFYQILLKEKQQQEQQKQQNGNGQNQDNSQSGEQNQEQQENGEGNNQEQQQNEQNPEPENGQGNGQENEQDKDSQNLDGGQQHGYDHSLWEEAFKEQQESQGKQKGKNSKKQQSQEQSQEQSDAQTIMDFDERGEFEDNRKEKREKFKSRREKTERNIRSTQTQDETIKLGNIGESKEAIDWKVLIRREIEESGTIWSQRRSIAENNYAYRLEENDIEDDAETEIMIDVSGSVELDLVKAFLRQIKPLLKQSKLRVGCFNERFWGMVDIKNVRDIDNFTIPQGARGHSAWTEDWDLAVRSFTKKREINKIVFTDGYPCPGTMPKEDLKRENVIWLVYGNEEFEPCCGKVINITEKQLEKLHQINTRTSLEDSSLQNFSKAENRPS